MLHHCTQAASNIISAQACTDALASVYLASAHAGLAYIAAIAGLAIACRVLARHI